MASKQVSQLSPWLMARCLQGAHAACPGEQRDRGDGLLSRCECPCHRWDGTGLSMDCQYYQEGKYDQYGN